jgi:4-diphosphocytidyl-2-C-methyl-D-erythritol kinase
VTTVTPLRRPSGAVVARVPAKLNLQLSVGPVRADGYHDLVTVFHAVSLFDEVTVSNAETTSVTVTGEGGRAVPLGPANLAVKAVTALARSAGVPGFGGRSGTAGVRHGRDAGGVCIEIRKRIPVAAGLAGGSADAAAALVACNELWRLGASAKELERVAVKIGSDVPFALAGGTAVGTGRGERLTPALASGSYHWVLAFAQSGLATPDVFATCDRLRAARSADGVAEPTLSTDLMAALRVGDPAVVGPLLSNDLQPAALSLQPVLRRTLAAGKESGALGAIVSGSGPTCAFLAAGATAASDLAVAITSAGVCRAVVQVTGPVPGASVIDAGLSAPNTDDSVVWYVHAAQVGGDRRARRPGRHRNLAGHRQSGGSGERPGDRDDPGSV